MYKLNVSGWMHIATSHQWNKLFGKRAQKHFQSSLMKPRWWQLYCVILFGQKIWGPDNLFSQTRELTFFIKSWTADWDPPTNQQQRPHYEKWRLSSIVWAETRTILWADGTPNELNRVLCKWPCAHSNTLWLMYARRSLTVPKCPICKSVI